MSIERYWDDMARYTAKKIANLEARSLLETDRERTLNDLRDSISEMAALFNLEEPHGISR